MSTAVIEGIIGAFYVNFSTKIPKNLIFAGLPAEGGVEMY